MTYNLYNLYHLEDYLSINTIYCPNGVDQHKINNNKKFLKNGGQVDVTPLVCCTVGCKWVTF